MHKYKSFAIGFLFVSALLMVAQPALAGDWWSRHKGIRGSGDIETEKREIGDFTRIVSSSFCDLEIKVGEEPSLKVSIDDNLLEYVITEVDRNTLEVYTEENLSTRRGCLIEITVPMLESVRITGSGDIEIEGLTGDEFDYRGSGSGDFQFDGEVKEVDLSLTGSGDVRAYELISERVTINVQGSGDVRLEGETGEIEIEVYGSGDVDTRGLIAKDAYVGVWGSGDVKVRPTEALDGRIYGSGDIYYYGDPEDLYRKVVGSGDIRRKR